MTKYQEYIREIREEYGERLDLVMERLAEIEQEAMQAEDGTFFANVAAYLRMQYQVVQMVWEQKLASLDEQALAELNRALYDGVRGEHYAHHWTNYAYACEHAGEENGKLFAAVFYAIMAKNPSVFQGNILELTLYAELIVELYNLTEEEEAGTKELQDCVYSFMHDNAELFQEKRIDTMLDPDKDGAVALLMEADLSDVSYLYRYGYYVGTDELESARFLNEMAAEEIQAMADTYTEGYRIGFAVCGKDISKKSVAEVRYPLGFERMVRAAELNLEQIGMRGIAKAYSSSPNKQFDYDHREDAALWMDKAYVERTRECIQAALEQNKTIAPLYGGPAVIEVFGEEPFSPQNKPKTPKYNKKQQQLAVQLQSEGVQLIYSYIHGEERSFTVIAYPVASIGPKYREIFARTVEINTLDYTSYQTMQQKIIDVLDTADYVHILGCNGNHTDLKVKVKDLANPQKETAFENCVADVNIPVGEVFTSPVLEGTNGKLHVTQVYLEGLNYLNLEMEFTDGMVTAYGCTNFENPEEGRKYILENVLHHHDTLPMGEFAIGTNTTAFCMAREYDIAEKMPILIAEKTGPHFAVGDTCYSFDEDNVSYNPDGKAIVARENSISAQRKSDPSKAYFNCHTDITIPYDELGAIVAVRKDGTQTDIIRNGRFVVPGTEELNVPLEAFLK